MTTYRKAMDAPGADFLRKADDGKPGESLKETSTEELKATLAKLKPTDPGSEARIKALKAELASRGNGGMEKAQTSLTPEKARMMLHERSGGHGRPITDQQRKFFGAIGGHLPAPGEKAKKSLDYADLDDFLEKAKTVTPIGGITPGGKKKVGKGKYVDVKEGGKSGAAAAPEKKTHQEVYAEIQGIMKTDPGVKQSMGEMAKELMSALGPSATPEDFKAVQVWMANAGSMLASAISTGKTDSSTIGVIGTNSTPKHDFSGDVGYRLSTRIGGQVGKFVKTAFNAYQEKHGGEKYEPATWAGDKGPVKKSMESAMSLDDWMEKAGRGGTGVGGKTKGGYTVKMVGGKKRYVKEKGKEPTQGQMGGDLPRGPGKEGKPDKPAGGLNTQGGQLPEPKVSTMGNATIRDYGELGLIRTQKGRHTVMDAEGTEIGEIGQYRDLKAAQDKLMSMKKSMENVMSLEDWMEKSGGLPTHQQGMGHKKSSAVEGGSADGGELADVGRTSGSSDSATGPGQDSQGQITGTGTKKDKLSEDDAEDEKQMKPHKKPIETIKKSAFPADQRDTVAREQAAAVSRLQKSEDVYVGPNLHPFSHHATHASGDAEASELVKSEDFYHGGSPQQAPQRPIIEQGVLCKSVNATGCDVTYSAALTSCPDCGAGTVGHRNLPGGPVMGAATTILEKSIGPGSLLRRPTQEPDVKIG